MTNQLPFNGTKKNPSLMFNKRSQKIEGQIHHV